MTYTKKALERARRLLEGGPRYRREANVTHDIAQLLTSLNDVEDADIEREQASGDGRIDIFLPRFRTVIEVKKPSAKSHAHQRLPSLLTDAQEQMERYVSSEVQAEQSRLNFEGRPLADRSWKGILSDGRWWRGWTYHGDSADPAASRQPSFLLGPDSEPEELLDTLARALDPDPALKTWIPTDPSELFRGRPETLHDLYKSMPDKIRPGTRTKLALWHDMLRASGLSPRGRAGDAAQFALHSFLIAVARMVTHLLSPAGGHWRSCLQDGFASWMLDWEGGAEWADSLWGTVRRYDWRSRRGDVLRVLYESFVAESDRRVFGEYYTPDWLAGMMVEQTLDDDWLAQAVPAAEEALRNGEPLRGIGVLDPACGSGTFLYHAALRMLQADAMDGLRPQQQADVAALLLNGIDVHPVAVEVAKATVMRALPAEPGAGASAIRIHLGDSLLTDEDYASLFGRREEAMRLETPQGRDFFVPLELVHRDDFPDAMRRIVLAAVERKPVPRFLLQSVSKSARRDLLECRDALEDAVQSEGNSVWSWYAVNRAAPHLLSKRKVDRIIANPPWVRLSGIQEYGRKRAMEGLGEQLRLQAGGKQAPNLDIAAFFVLRARKLYLQDPESDRGIWLVKRSALRAGHWRKFRDLHEKHLMQTVDLLELQPFGGGDARRCCLLAEHTAFSATDSTQGSPPQMKAELKSPGDKRPAPDEEWRDVQQRIRLVAMRPLPPQARSDYAPAEFRRGAEVFPYVLVVARTVSPQGQNRVLVETKKSLHKPWRDVLPQDVEVPRSWISRLLLSQHLLAFIVSGSEIQAIIPMEETGNLVLDSATNEPGWRRLNDLYKRHRGQGGNTPKTLVEQIDHRGKLSSQLLCRPSGRRMVLYPNSGDIMRSARTRPSLGVVSGSLCWHVTGSEGEAGYLVSLLNAPSLRRAFRKSRGSGRHFAQNPWRKVPIPRFDPKDKCHKQLAQLCERAEAEAEDVCNRFPGSGQVKVSTEIRARLAECGIAARIDALVAHLLPDQVGS